MYRSNTHTHACAYQKNATCCTPLSSHQHAQTRTYFVTIATCAPHRLQAPDAATPPPAIATGASAPHPASGAAQAGGHATSAFAIAASMLSRLQRNAALAEVVPDTLELLLRACLEGRHLAEDSTGGDGDSSGGGAVVRARAAAVLGGALRLCARGGGCFLEVVARASRKMEPDWYPLLFPLRMGGGAAVAEAAAEPGAEYEGAHPTHLMHACLEQGRLATAAWFLPLVR
jgi:hypothetical protein